MREGGTVAEEGLVVAGRGCQSGGCKCKPIGEPLHILFDRPGLGHIGPGTSRLGMVLTSIEAILGAVRIALAVLVIGRRFMRQG